MINFNCTQTELELIGRIADRFLAQFKSTRRLDVLMDITACHCNGCPLDLEKLVCADDFSFVHDVLGIMRHLNRGSGQLNQHFLPRFAIM